MPKPAVASLALLLALSWGAGDAFAASAPAVAVYTDEVWWKKGAVTLIDPDSFTVLGTAEFDQVVRPLGFDSTGRTLLVVGWPRSKNEPANLWSIDTESAASTALGELGSGMQLTFSDPGFRRLYVVTGAKKSKPKTISVFDLVELKPLGQLASVEHMTLLQLSPDGALLYAFCQGQKHKRPKGPPGNLHVLDAMAGTELARLEAGQGASSVAFDVKRGLAYVMGAAEPPMVDPPPKGEIAPGLDAKGKLTVLRGGSVVARLDVRGRPTGLRFAPDGSSYLLTSSAVVALDGDGLSARHTWALSFGPSELIFDPGRDLMFAGASAGSEIAEMRMSGDGVMVERPTGSPGRKFRAGVGEVLLGIIAAAGAVGGTPLAGGDPWVHSSTMMLLGSDGAILYVVNPRTNDVSLFDVAKREVVDFVPIGGASPERILQLPGDPNFWVQSPWSLAYFNTSTNRIDRTISIVIGFDMARERAWIGTKTTAMVVDLRSGEVLGQPDLPKKYVRIWIDNSRKPEQESPHP